LHISELLVFVRRDDHVHTLDSLGEGRVHLLGLKLKLKKSAIDLVDDQHRLDSLTKSLSKQSADVSGSVKRLRLLLIATWGVYPISFILNMNADPQAPNWDTFMGREIGYTIADILAKCLFGITIYKIARKKSFEDDAAFMKEETKETA